MEMAKMKTMTGSRYLSFAIKDEEYGIEILRIKEIMAMIEITEIPKTPAFIKGVINLRGKIIPIIDLRIKFGLESREYTDRTCIIVVEIQLKGEQTLMGIVVDSIQEVVSIPDEKISDVPYLNSRLNSEFIKGIAETGDSVKIILDIVKVLTEEEFVLMQEINREAPGMRIGTDSETAGSTGGKGE